MGPKGVTAWKSFPKSCKMKVVRAALWVLVCSHLRPPWSGSEWPGRLWS